MVEADYTIIKQNSYSMEAKMSESKHIRMLSLYIRLNAGEVLTKKGLAEEFNVNERSIQRDIDSIRDFLYTEHPDQIITYDHKSKGYKLTDNSHKSLDNNEILAVCKILLESRSMRSDEMFPILDKLIDCATPIQNQQEVKSLISNEKHHYIPPHHNTPILNRLWELGEAIEHQHLIDIEYSRLKRDSDGIEVVERILQPVGIMFSEYYFYLTAFQNNQSNREHFDNPDDIFPTIYRIDRIKSLKVLSEHFQIPYSDRFEEGEFRKRVQFMYGGTLQHITFRFTGPSVEAILDRLPTAEIKEGNQESGYTIEAEVFGKGIEMWLRSQGDYISDIKMNQIIIT